MQGCLVWIIAIGIACCLGPLAPIAIAIFAIFMGIAFVLGQGDDLNPW